VAARADARLAIRILSIILAAICGGQTSTPSLFTLDFSVAIAERWCQKKGAGWQLKAKPDTTEGNVAAEKEAHCKMQRQSSRGALIVDLKIPETSEDS